MFNQHDKELPVLPSRRCKLLARVLQLSILLIPLLVGILFFMIDGWMLFIMGLMFGLLIQNIVRSKLRTHALPSHQQAYDFTDIELSSWVMFTRYC